MVVNNTSWIRKDAWIMRLRGILHRFRILNVEISEHLEEYPLHPEAISFDDQEWAPNGNSVITIKLIGVWRRHSEKARSNQL